MADTPIYYVNNFPTITGDIGAIEDKLAGEGSNLLVSSLSEYLKVGRESTTLNFLTKSTASEFVGQTVRIVFNPDTAQYQVDGKVVVNIAGGAATDAVVAGVLSAVLSALGVGTSVVGVTAVAVGLASFWLWDALSEETDSDEEIASFIDNVIISVRGPVPVDVQIVDTNGNVLGGVLFEEDVDQAAEFETIKKLLGRTLLTSFPDISIGKDRIKVVEKTRFSPQEKEYKVYDGRFVDAISQELGIAKEELLGLGQENSPNTNAQIYYESPTFNLKSFVFASDENSFFVPLPDTSGGVAPVGLHPGNIISGSSGDDTLDAFQDRDRDLLFNRQNVLLLGLDGNDTINGNVEDDIIVGGKGNDTINGGSGKDVAIFSDALENYKISLSTIGNLTISHIKGTRTDDTDTLTNVEFVKFRENVLSVADLKPSQQIGSYEVKQVSADDVVSNVPTISGTQVFWQEKVGSSLLSEEKTIRFDTNTGLLSVLSGRTSSSINSYAQLAVNEDKVLLLVDYNDRSPHKLEFYTGESLVRVGNVSDFDNRAKIFGDNILLETRPGFQLVAYNYRNGTTTLLADRPSNFLGLPSFPGVSSVLTSGRNAAWVGSIGASIGDIFFYNGQTTVQIPEINEVNGLTYNRFPSNLQIDGNKLFWTSSNLMDGSLMDMFLYDGVGTRKIGEVSNRGQVLDFKFSGNRVVWTTKAIARNNLPIDAVLDGLYLYDGGSIKSIYEAKKTNELSTAGIKNLTLSGENIVWTETVAAAFNPRIAVGQNFYLYDIGNSNAQPKLLSNNVDTLLYNFSFELFGEQVAWTAPDNVGKTQLYAYDGNSVWQLTNLPPNNGGYGNYISQFEVSEKGVVWIGDDDGEVDRSFKVGEEIFVATLIREGGIENNPATPTPDPIPTPNPIPTPTPDPIPTPTSKFQVSLVESKSNLVNELAVFTVDDDAGTINGLVPGSEGYAQAALNKARSIFSTIANLPNGFDTGNLSSIIEFDTASSLRFMLVKNSTLDNVKNGITPISDLLLSDLSVQQISNLADSVFPLSWKDSFGNTTDFKDLVIKIGANTETLPLGTAIQSKSGIEVIDLRSNLPPNQIVKAEFSVYREAAFNNYVGFYKINDTDGSVTDPLTGNILKPGDVGYIQTAVGNRVAGIDLKVANKSIETLSGEFISGSLFAPFIIINASPTEVLDTNIQNDPNVYFAFLGANTDRVDHIRLLSNNVFGFEDLPNGGDLDYNDMIIAANFRVS
jgi:hypothetical protein